MEELLAPIAITGFGMRFPGGIDDENSFWNFISEGRIGIVDMPNDRWDVSRFYDPDPDKPGKMYVKNGGFLQSPIDAFDALYFGITPREAECMDPQQRLLLQVVWEALNNAGIIPEQLAGSDTGVYVGAFTLDNLIHQMGPQARQLVGAHTAVGSTMTILSNRISYLLDLRGPSLSIDTACSSSLVALHHACHAIWSGNCALALVGGVNVMFRPEYFIAMCKGKFLAKDGRCKSFDARADGYGRGEGAGALVLKPLAQAQQDGDIIHGVIKATGVNQDGRSNGITSPNRESQIALIRQVHAQAGISPDQIRYVEAHGTGTQAGDTAECHALGEALGQHRAAPLPVGSVKANLGHLEAASGIAGVIKSMLCLKHKKILPIAGLQQENPDIPFAGLGLHLPRGLEDMAVADGEKAYAAVNSFGYGGTNAHILLEEAPPRQAAPALENGGDYLLPVSAKDRQGLVGLVQAYRQDLERQPQRDLAHYCFSAATRRGHNQHRVVLAGKDAAELVAQCDAFCQHQSGPRLRAGEFTGVARNPVFVFTGMGPQWWGMGQQLYADNAVFRAELDRCDAAFSAVSGWSILEEMHKDESSSRMASTVIAQPANFLLQAGLAALWKSRGVEPAAIVGHSVGEVSAAYVAGVLSLEEAALVSFHRSRIQSKAAGQGGMLATGLGEAQAHRLLADYAGALVDIAAVNGPDSITLSGDLAVLQDIAVRLDGEGIFQRALQVEVPYHSPYMDPLMDEMRQALASLKPASPRIPLYSTVTGTAVSGPAYDADYWCRNARQAVLFAPAMMQILQDGHALFLEVGPHPVLSTSIKQCAAAARQPIAAVASLNRKEPEQHSISMATAELHVAGCALDWKKLFPASAEYVPLPAYPWQNTRYWLESDISRADRLDRVEHPLLGMRKSCPDPLWRNHLNSQLQPYLPDHCVEDLVVLPGAAYVELGLSAHHSLHQWQQWALEDLSFFSALIIGQGEEPELETRVDMAARTYAVYSKGADSNSWQAHARGKLSVLPLGSRARLSLETLLGGMQARRSHGDHYQNMTSRKLQYGPCFQGVRDIWQDERSVLANIQAPADVGAGMVNYHLHPAVLDACFQALLSLVPLQDKRAFVPTHIRQVRYYQPLPQEIWCYGQVESFTSDALVGSLTLCDASGDVLVELTGIKARALSGAEQLSPAELDDWLYQYEWLAQERPEFEPQGRWILAGDIRLPSLAGQLQGTLSTLGLDLVEVEFADQFRQLDPRSFQVRADQQDDFVQLLAALDADCDGLIYVPPQQAQPSPVDSGKTLALLGALQGMVRSGSHRVRQLCCVTAAAQPVDTAQLNLPETGIVALLRVAANEYPEYAFRSIDTDADTAIESVAAEILCGSDENEVVLRGAVRKAMRMVRTQADRLQAAHDERTAASPRFTLQTAASAVVLRELAEPALQPGQIELKLDVATLAQADEPAPAAAHRNYGLAARLLVGTVARQGGGIDITGLPACVLSEQPVASHLVAPFSDAVLLEADGPVVQSSPASVLALVAAHRMLVDTAHIAAGQSVLIQGADSAVGMAAVQVALSHHARVYVTLENVTHENVTHENVAQVNEPQVKSSAALQAQFLSAGVKACLDSATLDFSEFLLRETAGTGLDIVLNPFDGERAQHSAALVKAGGCLLGFGTEALLAKPGSTLYLLQLDRLLLDQPQAFRVALQQVCEGLRTGLYFPLAEQQIDIRQLHSGATADPAVARTLQLSGSQDAALFKANPVTIDPEATYLITGGFGGFGQGIVRQLAARGAKHLAILSRSGAKSAQDQALLQELANQGIEVIAPCVDVASSEQMDALFSGALAAMPPLKGIVHTAGVLDDSPINFVTADKLARVMGPKVQGAWNLHRHSLAQSQPLDFFILFSSVSAMIGAAGQATYVIANVWLDGLAHYRQSMGLSATSVGWGALDEVGMAAVDPSVVAYFERVGLRPMKPAKVFEAFRQVLDWQAPHLGLVDMNWANWASYYPSWAQSPRYAHLVPTVAEDSLQSGDWLAEWADKSADEQLDDILQRLILVVARTMKIPEERVGGSDSLPNLGIDSLIAMELQTVIQQDLQVRLSTLELMKGTSLRQMAEQVAAKFRDGMAAAVAVTATEPEAPLLESLDDEQLDDVLSALMQE